MATYRAVCKRGGACRLARLLHLLSILLLFARACHGLTVPVLASEANHLQSHPQNFRGLQQHRKLQQNVHSDMSYADLDNKDTKAHHVRLQHYRQAHSVPTLSDQSQPTHNPSSAAATALHSHQHQPSNALEPDTAAAVDVYAETLSVTHTAPAVEHILYPNSPQWRENDTQWHRVHESYARQLASGQKFDLILYGDSIFESLLGSVVGNPVERAAGLPEVWAQFHNTDTDKIFALAGDGADDMVWRLKNGETPAAGQVKQIVLLIGSNDLDYYWDNLTDLTQRQESVKSVVASVTQCIDILASGCPSTEIFVMSLMHKGVRWLAPEAVHVLPNRFTPAIDAINEELERVAASWTGGRVQFVDCSYFFVNHDTEGNPTGMNSDLVPDTLHPNPLGFHKVLTECIEPGVHRTIADNQLTV